MIESREVGTWLAALLKGDGPLHALVADRIYRANAPQGTPTHPYLVHQLVSATDRNTLAGHRVMQSCLLQVRAVDAGRSQDRNKAVMDRVDTLLTRPTGATASANIMSCVREQTTEYAEVVDGREYQHLTAIYRVLVQAL